MSDDENKSIPISKTLEKIGQAFLAKQFSEVGAASFSIENGVMTMIIDRNEIRKIVKETSNMYPNCLALIGEKDIMSAVKEIINEQINLFLV